MRVARHDFEAIVEDKTRWAVTRVTDLSDGCERFFLTKDSFTNLREEEEEEEEEEREKKDLDLARRRETVIG